MWVDKRYWKWDDSLNPTRYKLREEVQPLLDSLLLFEIKDDLTNNIEYTGPREIPWRVTAEAGRIDKVFFSQQIKVELLGKDLTDLMLPEVEAFLNSHLEKTNQDYTGDVLSIFFGDQFIKAASYFISTPEFE